MFAEPVWLGNSIVPRWEAIAILGGGLALAVLTIAATVCIVYFVWKRAT